jgi:hypothetical protein
VRVEDVRLLVAEPPNGVGALIMDLGPYLSDGRLQSRPLVFWPVRQKVRNLDLRVPQMARGAERDSRGRGETADLTLGKLRDRSRPRRAPLEPRSPGPHPHRTRRPGSGVLS